MTMSINKNALRFISFVFNLFLLTYLNVNIIYHNRPSANFGWLVQVPMRDTRPP